MTKKSKPRVRHTFEQWVEAVRRELRGDAARQPARITTLAPDLRERVVKVLADESGVPQASICGTDEELFAALVYSTRTHMHEEEDCRGDFRTKLLLG